MLYELKTGLVGLLVLAVLMFCFINLMNILSADIKYMILVALSGWKISEIAIGIARTIVRRDNDA